VEPKVEPTIIFTEASSRSWGAIRLERADMHVTLGPLGEMPIHMKEKRLQLPKDSWTVKKKYAPVMIIVDNIHNCGPILSEGAQLKQGNQQGLLPGSDVEGTCADCHGCRRRRIGLMALPEASRYDSRPKLANSTFGQPSSGSRCASPQYHSSNHLI
jgi:hypothetical protein